MCDPATVVLTRCFKLLSFFYTFHNSDDDVKGSPYSIIERRVPEQIPVLGSHPASDVSHKPGGRLPLISVSSTFTLY